MFKNLIFKKKDKNIEPGSYFVCKGNLHYFYFLISIKGKKRNIWHYKDCFYNDYTNNLVEENVHRIMDPWYIKQLCNVDSEFVRLMSDYNTFPCYNKNDKDNCIISPGNFVFFPERNKAKYIDKVYEIIYKNDFLIIVDIFKTKLGLKRHYCRERKAIELKKFFLTEVILDKSILLDDFQIKDILSETDDFFNTDYRRNKYELDKD